MTDTEAPDPNYSYRPSLLGAPHEFQLRAEGLGWRVGSRTGVAPYDTIRRVRLSFRPMPLQSHRFLTEIWADRAPKLQLASTSARSMVEVERQDAKYSDFVMQLHHRIAAVRGDAVFESGKNPVIYWIGLVLFAAIALALAALAVRGLQAESYAGAVFIVGFLGLFLWQMGNFFRRNVPRRYAPDAPPADLLPR